MQDQVTIQKLIIFPLKTWKNSTFGNNLHISQFYSKEIEEQIAVRQCLLSFGAECFVFQFAIQNLNNKIYQTIILPVVLYGCETWSLKSRKERRLSVFENRVLRGIFGAKRDEVTEDWRKLHNEELNDLYCSPNIVRVIKSR
jgi:hypothetical protein